MTKRDAKLFSVIQKLALRPHIKLIEDTFINLTSDATFIDCKYGEWTTEARSVIIKNCEHPQRSIAKTILRLSYTESEITEKIYSIHKDSIVLIPGTFTKVRKKAKFIDSTYGEFERIVYDILKGKKHPYHGRDKIRAPKLSIEAIKSRLPSHIKLRDETYRNVHAPAVFIDEKYGEWETTANDIFSGHHDHPSRNINRSKGESNMSNWIESVCGTVSRNYRVGRGGKKFWEIDCYIPEFKLGVEYHGLKFHSEWNQKISTYHIEKSRFIKDRGISLIEIYCNEWQFKQPIVKSIIKAKLGLVDNKYYARKLIIKPVENQQAQEFLNNNHLMGEFRSAKHLGLFTKENELVSLIGYKKHKDGIDISRFCNKLDSSVAGGLSKLLKEIQRVNPDAKFIQSWVDLRYGTGASLLKCGFTHVKTTLGWKWTDGHHTFNRLKCRANMDERKLTEKQHAEELGWYKIYDSGQSLFTR